MENTVRDPDNDTTIFFEEGVIGVPLARRFELMTRDDSPLCVLRCLDIEGFNLPVVNPRLVDPVYKPRLAERVNQILEAGEEPLLFLAVTAVGSEGAVANLKAPVVVNVAQRTAVQVILEGDYPLRAPVDLAEVETT